MMRVCFALLLVAAVAQGEDAKLHLAVDPVEDGNRYIIASKNNVAIGGVEADLVEMASKNDSIEFTVVWKIEIGLKFMYAQMNKAGLEAARQHDGVVYIEQDSWVHAQGEKTFAGKDDETSGKGKKGAAGKKGNQGETKEPKDDQLTDQWGLDRIDQRNVPLDGVFSVPPFAGTGTSIYVIGTGLNVKHEDFGGRATNIYDFRGDDSNGRDCNGHGTHMASLAAGKKYGVAKNATLYGLRLTRCRGSGKLSDTIKGMNWLARNVARKCVALVGVASPGQSPSLDNAIHGLYTAGCVVVVPAGNNNSNACDFSPARMQGPITVGASTSVDYAVFFSNQDDCVDVFAPGLRVEGAFYDSATSIEKMGGTSMAAAYVAGASALHLGNDMRLFKVKDYLLRHATLDQLQQVHEGTPNKLLYIGKVSSSIDYNRPVKSKIKTTSTSEKGEKSDGKDEKAKNTTDSQTAGSPKTEL